MDAFRNQEKRVVFPVHPAQKNNLCEYGLWILQSENIRYIDPLGYIAMLHLMKHAKKNYDRLWGIQKEAYVLGNPVHYNA